MIQLLHEFEKQKTQQRFEYIDRASRNRVVGVVVRTLNEYAGDDERRRTFLKAEFGVDSTRHLTDPQLYAVWAWQNHPDARNEVNLSIAEYLKAQGRTEMELFNHALP